MRTGMKMLLMTNRKDGNDRPRSEYEMAGGRSMPYDRRRTVPRNEYGGGNETEYETTRTEYNGSEMNYGGVEGRFRDRGRPEHNDNEIENRRYRRYRDGRFAPGNTYDDAEYPEHPFGGDGGSHPLERMGFALEPNAQGRVIPYPHMAAAEREMPPMMMSGMNNDGSEKLTKVKAEEWMRSLQNEDGTKGAHWTLEQAKQLMAQKNIQCDPVEFWVALNIMYSDYSGIAKRSNANTVDFYAGMAEAFLKDKDAQGDKLAKYFEHVVRH